VLLAGASAVVSGVGPGLGRSISLAFAREGASVALGARTTSTLERVAAEITADGGRAVWRRTDITNDGDCVALVETAADAFGGVDVLVNSGHHKGDFTPCESSDISTWSDVFAVNLFGPMRLIQAAIPFMRERRGGRIVNVNSGAVISSNPGLGAYAASKSGLASVTKVLAQELGRDGIRVNGVYVSSMVGENIREFGAGEAARLGVGIDDWLQEKAVREFALGIMPHPDDIADVIVFLASDLSRTITGQNLSANNGQWVTGPQ
jgi:NAD(P)-dependent dehydrogenase (short-subunit alcohol dehydrogenase family)